ncbi:MAG: hypothetical protein KBF67_14730 [Flavobacteriales bacterium]|nr:hypothetical protein [Flavobacteriales bacterium]
MFTFSTVSIIVIIAITFWACWRIPKPERWGFYSVLQLSILVALLTEVAGALATNTTGKNAISYNVCTLVEFLLLLWMVERYRPHWRTQVMVAALIGSLGFVCGLFFNDPFAFLMTEVILGYAIVICVVSLAVLWSIANTSDRALQRVPEFWIFMGLLIFFGGMIPVIGLIRFIFYDDPRLAAQLYHIMFVLIILRYGIDIYACSLAERTERADRDG